MTNTVLIEIEVSSLNQFNWHFNRYPSIKHKGLILSRSWIFKLHQKLDREIIFHTELEDKFSNSYFHREAMVMQYIEKVEYPHFHQLVNFYLEAPRIPDEYV